MKLKKSNIVFFITMTVLVLLLVFSDEVKQGAINGLLICGNVLIPSLFPFAVLSVFLTNSGLIFYAAKLFNKPAMLAFKLSGFEMSIMLLSAIGGYPIGAAIINQATQSKLINQKRAKNLICFCVNAGPAFIIMAVGSSILHSKEIGILLFISHIIASFIMAAVLGRKLDAQTYQTQKIKPASITDSFVNATSLSANSVLGICAWVVLFSAISKVITSLISNPVIAKYLTLPLEITNSVLIMSKNIYAVCFLLGFSGLCIHLQVFSLLKENRPKYSCFFVSRIAHGALSCIILKILLKIFPQSVYTMRNHNSFSFKGSSVSLACSFALVLMSVCLLLTSKNSRKIENYVLK